MVKANMKEVYREMMHKLWHSNEVVNEDKEWIDLFSGKENLKFSECVGIEDLYIQIFGKLPE